MGHSTPDFAIEIHAKALANRFKRHARIQAQSHAERLKVQGDEEGHEVWMAVAAKVDEIQSKPEPKDDPLSANLFVNCGKGPLF